MVMGTPAFMSPEQALAKSSEIDAQSDLWAVGAVLFTLASGQLVHDGDNAQEILVKAATTPASSLAAKLPAAHRQVVQLVDRALAFDRGARWLTAVAMRDALIAASCAAFGVTPSRDGLAALLTSKMRSSSVLPMLTGGSDAPPASASPVEPTLGDAAPTVHMTEAWRSPPSYVAAPHQSRRSGLTTAQPVAQDGDSPRSSSRRRRTVAWAAAALGLLVLATAGVLLRAGSDALRVPAPPSAAKAAPSIVAPRSPETLPPSASGRSEPASIRVDDLPQALTQPQAPARRQAPPPTTVLGGSSMPVAPSGPTSQPAPTSNCNPPFRIDAEGNKKWKMECL
jgi:serine/threonine-protein kinase